VSKNKPKETIEYVVRLQDKERQIVNEFLTSQQVLNYAEAFDKFTSFENLYLLVTVLEIVTGKEILPGTPNDIYKIIDFLRDFDFSKITPTIFADPDGNKNNWDAFWDVNLRADFDRFIGGIR
tara:strand:+ start:10 stop:378 length:369 start_codon:yes stop_codon:yes gene_type:complete